MNKKRMILESFAKKERIPIFWHDYLMSIQDPNFKKFFTDIDGIRQTREFNQYYYQKKNRLDSTSDENEKKKTQDTLRLLQYIQRELYPYFMRDANLKSRLYDLKNEVQNFELNMMSNPPMTQQQPMQRPYTQMNPQPTPQNQQYGGY